jgi:hypothetical protein
MGSVNTARLVSLGSLAGCSGLGVRVAVIDSGVHASHPHVHGISSEAAFDDAGSPAADAVDRLGHGTAVAAAIREKAPDAELLSVKVFDRSLAATAAALASAICWAADQGARLINLSLGTTNPEHAAALAAAIDHATRAGAIVVAAAPDARHAWLPGGLDGVVAVALDWDCPRDACRIVLTDAARLDASASGYPRPIPGVPPERNLRGVSFAVANACGLLALVVQEISARSAGDLRAWLESSPERA